MIKQQFRNTARLLLLASNLLVQSLHAQTCNISSANCSQTALQNCLTTATTVNISGCTLTGVSLSVPNNTTVNITLDQGSNVVATWNGGNANSAIRVNNVLITNKTNQPPTFDVLNTTYGGSLTAMLSALPIEMVRFDAKLVSADATLLTWETARERDNAGYEVLWSSNARDWSSIGSVKPASPNSSDVQKYEFKHDSPTKGMNYYQVLQKDLSGTEWLSPIRSVKKANSKLEAIQLYPNPAQSIINLSNVHDDALTYSIFDVFGREVSQEQNIPSTGQIDVSQLQAGIYQLLISDGSEFSQTTLNISK